MYNEQFKIPWLKAIGFSFSVLIALILICFITAFAARHYDVWAMEMRGKAQLMEATQTRQIQIEQARGEKEAALLRAEAISIVGQAAKDFPEYRTQEFIGGFSEALKEGTISQIIYIPTEANIPILEAQRKTNQQ